VRTCIIPFFYRLNALPATQPTVSKHCEVIKLQSFVIFSLWPPYVIGYAVKVWTFLFSGFFVAPHVLSAECNCHKLFLTLNVQLRFQHLTNTVADRDKSYDDDVNGDVVYN